MFGLTLQCPLHLGPYVLEVFWTLVVLALICLMVSFGRLSSVVSESPVHKALGCTIVVVGFFLVGNIGVFF